MSRASPAQAGFLLADMLVTLTVSAFVLVGLTGLSAVLLRTADRSVAQLQAEDELGATMASLERRLRAAARARFTGPEPQPFLFNGDQQRLMFAEREAATKRLRGLDVLAYRSDPDGTLLRADAPLPLRAAGPGDLAFGEARAIHRGQARLRFAYRGAPESGRAAPWVPSWPIGMHMPTAVAVEAVDGSGRQVIARLEVPIMADTDIGCLVGNFCGRADPSGDVAAPSESGSPASPQGKTP